MGPAPSDLGDCPLGEECPGETGKATTANSILKDGVLKCRRCSVMIIQDCDPWQCPAQGGKGITRGIEGHGGRKMCVRCCRIVNDDANKAYEAQMD